MVSPFTGTFLSGPFLRLDVTDPSLNPIIKTEPVTSRKMRTYEDANDVGEIKGYNVEIYVETVDAPTQFNFDSPTLSWFSLCDLIPLASIASGTPKAVLGLMHTIAHLAQAIFDKQNRYEHLKEAGLGFYNVVRGTIAVVPLFGNGIVAAFDVYRIYQARKIHTAKIRAYLRAGNIEL